MASTNVSFRLDSELKQQAESLFADIGINMTSALTMFLKQAVRMQGIPFEVTRKPNATTLAALKETEQLIQDPQTQLYKDVEKFLADMKA